MRDHRERSTPATKRPYTTGHFELADRRAQFDRVSEVRRRRTRSSVEHDRGTDRPRQPPHQAHVDVRDRADHDRLRHLRRDRRPASGSRARGARQCEPSQRADHARATSISSSTFEHEFRDALILETTFPTLDGSSKEAGVPQDQDPARGRHAPARAPAARSVGTSARSRRCGRRRRSASTSTASTSCSTRTRSSRSRSSRASRSSTTGEERFPQIEPTKIEYPEPHRHDRARVRRQADRVARRRSSRRRQDDPKAQKTGSTRVPRPDAKQGAVRRSTCSRSACTPSRSSQSTANARRRSSA